MRHTVWSVILLLPLVLRGQVTLIWDNSGDYPDSVRQNVYVAGNFNGWQPGDAKYKMQEKNGKMILVVDAPKNISMLEFKCTRGSWDDGEVTAQGGYAENHTAANVKGSSAHFVIGGFQSAFSVAQKEANPNVETWVIHSNILQADKTIRVYVPCKDAMQDKRYNVMYMLDGQNLFDDVYAFAGEWGADEMMDSVCTKTGIEPAIIVGIDNAGAERMKEYFPWEYHFPGFSGRGYGDRFSDFVAEELKPKIDSMYRTKNDREHTAIVGSSMGGLMSLYMTLDHPEVFAKAGVFSPSFQMSDSNFVFAKMYNGTQEIDLYFLCGALEGGDTEMMLNMEKMYSLLLNKNDPHIRMRMTIQADAQHTESFWRKELWGMYSWMFSEE